MLMNTNKFNSSAKTKEIFLEDHKGKINSAETKGHNMIEKG